MSPPKYAANTSVPVDTSRGELTGLLTKHGIREMGWMTKPGGDELMFNLHGHTYKFSILRPTVEELQEEYRNDGGKGFNNVDWASRVTQEWRRRWRAHVLLLKAKLEFAAAEQSTIERELMPYILLADGRTLEDVVTDDGLPALTGGIPLLTAGSR